MYFSEIQFVRTEKHEPLRGVGGGGKTCVEVNDPIGIVPESLFVILLSRVFAVPIGGDVTVLTAVVSQGFG